ncbi:MAG: hypothetical protein QOI66_1761, partial [Myxococcales bacterium]|nr:hypothetical protein [Myxococcales bacterium]
MRSRHLVLAVISLLSFYGCGGSSPGNRDAADGSVDTNKDTPSDKATDGAGGAGADAKDAPDVADVPKVDASTDSTDGGGEVGGPPPCTAATECPGQDSECKHRTCTAGVCGTANEATAKVLATQVIGDCRVRQCAADGTVATLIDDKDIPDDLNSCTKDVCTAGVASHAPLAKDTACGGGKLCNATGQCVGCNTAADCPGADTFCGTRTCVQNTCGVTFKAEGTKLVDSQSGDCKIQQCDGKGVIQTVASATDLPVDNNPCTQDQCNGTTPTHQPVARNTTCGAGQVCDGASHCVTCLTAASCPGTDTQCQSRTCVSGSCGMSFATAGKAVTGQVSGDCSKKQCNGTGMIVSVVDSTDPLVDNNPCTKDLCDNGQPSNPPLAARTNCGANLQCDGAGKCVTCLTTADCPGADTECQSRTCTAGTCGIAFKAAGTLVSNQTAGDCKQNQCDGKGVVTTVVDDGDTQNDNNPCTDDLCSGGTSSHPNKAAKVTCGTSLECDGAGHCVGCVADAECGTNTECVTFKCTSGTCGKTSTAAGTPVMAQTAKDCKKNQCDGAGNVATVVDDSDVPVDGFTCTMDVCMAGAPSNPALPLGTTCAQANGTMCNGTGSCVQCITAANCGTDTSGCKSFTCTVGVCGVVNAPSGSAPTNVDQTAGDCQKIVCNGSGARTSIDDNTDKPVDNKVCTDDLCTTGVPSNPPFGTNVTCNANGGTHCDGAGACVVCNVDAECVTPMDNFCLKHTCVNHVCSDTSSPPENTIVTTMQVADDCQDVICGGSHNITSRLNPTDDDDSNPCTTDSCNGDTPVHSPIAEGSACGNGKCNAAGRCDSCLHDSDCGMSTDCAAQVCNTSTGKCGTQLAPAGFVPQNGQTSGDCKKVQCDGAGNAAPVADPTDNDDGNSCTTDSCSGTNAVHMPVATGTSCTAATGPAMVCSASGVCVGCNTDADCGGTSPDGCTVNVCNTTDHICGRMDPGAGSLAISQTAQDCKKNVCDGNGNAVSANDDNDVFDDGNACTQNLCINGMRSNPPMTAGTTTCSQNGGTVCDKSAQCVPTFMTVRVGDSASTTALAAITAVVSVEEYTVSDGTLVRRITVPAAGATNAFTLGGSAGSEGGLALSGNGKFVTLAGYKTAAGN